MRWTPLLTHALRSMQELAKSCANTGAGVRFHCTFISPLEFESVELTCSGGSSNWPRNSGQSRQQRPPSVTPGDRVSPPIVIEPVPHRRGHSLPRRASEYSRSLAPAQKPISSQPRPGHQEPSHLSVVEPRLRQIEHSRVTVTAGDRKKCSTTEAWYDVLHHSWWAASAAGAGATNSTTDACAANSAGAGMINPALHHESQYGELGGCRSWNAVNHRWSLCTAARRIQTTRTGQRAPPQTLQLWRRIPHLPLEPRARSNKALRR